MKKWIAAIFGLFVLTGCGGLFQPMPTPDEDTIATQVAAILTTMPTATGEAGGQPTQPLPTIPPTETPLMPTVSRIVGPFLGPKGKMPIPVPRQAPIDSILERERRVVVLRSRDKPQIQCLVGVEDMENEILAENIEAIVSNLTRVLKKGAGNIKSAYVKLTMGEAVKLI